MSQSRLWLKVLFVTVIVLLAVAPCAALAAPQESSAASTSAAVISAPPPPRAGPPPPPKAGLCSYRVRRGDTLANIAWHRFTSVSYLAWINGIRNPNLVYAGQWLRVPCRSR